MGKLLRINLSDEALKDLQQLQEDLAVDSLKETIRSSVSLMKFLIQEEDKGYSVIIQGPDGSERYLDVRAQSYYDRAWYNKLIQAYKEMADLACQQTYAATTCRERNDEKLCYACKRHDEILHELEEFGRE